MTSPAFVVGVVLSGLTLVPSAHATKPCPPSPCESANGQLDRAACTRAATWVAQGKVSKVVHQREGAPTSRDFATFSFTPVAWEKPAAGAGEAQRYTVGWCNNRQPLPVRGSDWVRIFATSPDASNAPQYLYLESIARP